MVVSNPFEKSLSKWESSSPSFGVKNPKIMWAATNQEKIGCPTNPWESIYLFLLASCGWGGAIFQLIESKIYTRWFKVTFWSPSWRSLNPLKGSLNHPKKVTLNHQVKMFHITCIELDPLVNHGQSIYRRNRTQFCERTGGFFWVMTSPWKSANHFKNGGSFWMMKKPLLQKKKRWLFGKPTYENGGQGLAGILFDVLSLLPFSVHLVEF